MYFTLFIMQASPSDPKNLSFVMLGNKIDVDSGNNGTMSIFYHKLLPTLACIGFILYCC
jgi:hypothetical protein